MAFLIDLHIHSTASDGTMSPKELVEYAKKKNLEAIAITDHDTVGGAKEAVDAGKHHSIEVIPGVELSADFEPEMHILGLNIDYTNGEFLKDLIWIREQKSGRNSKIIERLNELGMDITLEEVEAEAKGGVVGRPHFAAVLLKKGYIKDRDEAFEKYLAHGKPAYVKREKVTPQKALEMILNANGVPILAHPGLLEKSPQQTEEIIVDLMKLGLKGIEVYHADHNEQMIKLLLHIAKKHNLLISGGSDFHGVNKTVKNDMGCIRVEYKFLEQIKQSSKTVE